MPPKKKKNKTKVTREDDVDKAGKVQRGGSQASLLLQTHGQTVKSPQTPSPPPDQDAPRRPRRPTGAGAAAEAPPPTNEDDEGDETPPLSYDLEPTSGAVPLPGRYVDSEEWWNTDMWEQLDNQYFDSLDRKMELKKHHNPQFAHEMQGLAESAQSLETAAKQSASESAITADRLRILLHRLVTQQRALHVRLQALYNEPSDFPTFEKIKAVTSQLSEVGKLIAQTNRHLANMNDAGTNVLATVKRHRTETSGKYGHGLYALPGKAPDQPPGECITPRTLLKRMRLTSTAHGRPTQHTYHHGNPDYIPHLLVNNGRSVIIPGGWSRFRLTQAVELGKRYVGNNPRSVPVRDRHPFGEYDVERSIHLDATIRTAVNNAEQSIRHSLHNIAEQQRAAQASFAESTRIIGTPRARASAGNYITAVRYPSRSWASRQLARHHTVHDDPLPTF